MYFCICYFRHLTGEVSQEWQLLEEGDKARRDELTKIMHEVVPYLMGHNAEPEACDLIMEIEKLDELMNYVDESAYAKVCLYLKRCALFSLFVLLH